MYFVKFKSQYISVFQDWKAYFTVNSSLSGVTQVLIKHRMSNAVDISALRVKHRMSTAVDISALRVNHQKNHQKNVSNGNESVILIT